MVVRYLGGPGSKKWILAMDGGERPSAGQKTPFPPEGELVELLWQDGAVVAHSQAQRAFGGDTGASGITDEAPAPWLPAGGGGGMGGDVYSQLWQSIAQADGRVGADVRVRPPAMSRNSGAGSSRTAGGEVGSSFCGSNLVAAALHLDDDIDDVAALPPPPEEPGPSTSSGWNSNALLKRSRDEFDSRSEDADFDTVDETPPSRRQASKRRTRAAEVHNMSERYC
nr:unnamed protein product [Digitaria exilis]CAB3455667.1 unnamed protein product [Digitaria exilis]